MFVFYISRWYPGKSTNVFLALGFGTAVGIPFCINSLLLKKFATDGNTLFSKNWFKTSVHVVTIYFSVLAFSAWSNTLIFEWEQFVIIFLVMLFMGFLPGLSFFYFGKYQSYRTSLELSLREKQELNEEVEQLRQNNATRHLKIPVRNGFYNLDLNSFCYAESNKNYLIVHFKNGEKVTIRSTLKQFLENCKNQDAIRQVHRAFAINTQHFNRIHSNWIVNDSLNIRVPISKSFRPTNWEGIQF